MQEKASKTGGNYITVLAQVNALIKSSKHISYLHCFRGGVCEIEYGLSINTRRKKVKILQKVMEED